MRTFVVTAMVLATSVWIGSMVCLAVVARAAGRLLAPADRVALFADVGRTYRVLGTASLLVILATGVALAGRTADWDPATKTAAVLAIALVALSVGGMRQAHRITELRRAGDDGPRVRRAGRNAALLRSSMAAISIAIVVVVAGSLSS